MANKSYKKAIVFALCLTMLMPLGSMAVSSTTDEAAGEANTASGDSSNAASDDSAADATELTEDTSSDDSASTDESTADTSEAETTDDSAADPTKDEDYVAPITDEDAAKLETCKQIADNANLTLYCDEENERVGLYVKASGKYWWSSPINAMADQTIIDDETGSTMKTAQRNQLASSAAIRVGDLRQEKRTESPAPVYSNKASVKWSSGTNGVVASYKYSAEGVSFKVHYELEDDNLYVYCDTSEIEEKNTSALDGKVLTKLTLCPSFGAEPTTNTDGTANEGYMIVPDGSGAVIEYNNGKSNYAAYSQQVYGRDYTAVPLNAPRVTQQAYLPVVATVSGTSGLVAVASDGESNVWAKAQVSGQNKQSYNTATFEFETRSSDSFFMSGDSSNKITVFEKNGIKTERFGVRYYPVDDEAGVNYADCAATYRNYLISKKGLTQKATANKNDLYLDLFGGVLKQTSILGIPFDLKTEITGFSQAKEIVDGLAGDGVSNVTVNYNDWTNKSMNGKISTSYSPSGTLGGSSDMEDLTATENLTLFPSLDNFTMDSSSWGYMTLTDTAVRVSNAYSRQSSYSLSFGVPQKGVSPALLSPNSYNDVFTEMIDSYKDEGISKIGFGDYASKLVSDYSNSSPSSRSATMQTVVDGYKKASEEVGNVIAESANSYVLPYVSDVTNVPVYSSGFNLTDYDIPFYQMVIHGYVSYSSTPINKSSNSDETFLLSLAAGSQIHYDMTYADADVIQDTDYNDLYYTNYKGWTDLAANQFKAAGNILSAVSDYTISRYELSDDKNTLTTTYSKDGANDVVISINKSTGTATVDGQSVELTDCIEGSLE